MREEPENGIAGEGAACGGEGAGENLAAPSTRDAACEAMRDANTAPVGQGLCPCCPGEDAAASEGPFGTDAPADAGAEADACEGAGTASVGQGPCPCRSDRDVAAARPAADGRLADAEAAALLRGADSGVRPDLSRRGYRLAKRAFDVVASGVAVVVLLVPGLLLSVVICAKSPGAGPLYGQLRVGRVNADGTYRLFRMWKFRSMVPGADQMLDGLRESNEADGPLFKMRDDPRVIPGVGPFIRRHSVDELPQLLNVLLGDMSLIGPRPGLPREVALYDGRARGRLAVKPGCGGAWQVSGRSDVGFERMVELDLEYVENRSAARDLALVFRTVGAMFTGKGAA